jgi:hypothetical protein
MLQVTVDSYLLQNLETEGDSCKTHRLVCVEERRAAAPQS